MSYRSYFAEYWSTDGKTLCGGVMHSRSSRFGLESDAKLRLTTALELNGPHCKGKISGSSQPPEIFPHCEGHPAQAVGGVCFGCKKVLTADDARKWRDPITQKAKHFFDEASGTMVGLWARWLDEKEYEDISDYAKPLESFAAAAGVKVLRMTKEPFGCIYSVDEREYTMMVRNMHVEYHRIK